MVYAGYFSTPFYKVFDHELLHAAFPPIEHMLSNFAEVVVAAAFLRYLLEDSQLSKRYLQISIGAIVLCYLVTFLWWGQYVLANPTSKFGQTWCDWVFRLTASLLLAYPVIILYQRTRGWIRNTVCVALTLFFLCEFLKIPDMALGEVYEAYFTPVRHGFYILAIPILGYVYLRKFYSKLFAYQNELQEMVDLRTQQLQEVNNTLQQDTEKIKLFAYSVAHDLKNPAIAIHGLTKLLKKRYQDILDVKGQKICTEIINSSGQINILAEQINVFISTKEHPLDVEEIDLKEIYHIVIEGYSSQLQDREIVWLEPQQSIKMRGDKIAIIRIIRNFIDNALKYGGDVLSKIDISYKESEEFHIISVSNDGNALPDDRKDIFGHFTRDVKNTKIDGAGLGLAIVKELVALHHGEVWKESGERGNVIFCFTILKRL